MEAGGSDAPPIRRHAATRGFLFADLRGYTALVEQRGAREAADVLDRYRRLVRQAVASHDGAEIRTEGDSFYVVFPDASAAVASAISIVESAAVETASDPRDPIHVGVGVHAGETIETSEGFVGAAVNLAARLCAAARPGEVLVSDTVRALTASVAPARYEHAGRRRLKGITDPVFVYRAVARDSPSGPRRQRARGIAVYALFGMGIAAGASAIGSLVIASFADDGVGSAVPSPGGGGIALASELAPPPSGPSPGADVRTFPGVGEADLLALVDDSYHVLCDSAEEGSMPQYVGPGPRGVGQPATAVRRNPTFSAGIVCRPVGAEDPDEVAYWIVADFWIEGGAEELIVNRAGVLSAPAGACVDDGRAIERWSVGPISGHLVCFETVGGAFIYWTYDGTDVFGKASRADGDLDALLRWWNEEARYRQP